MRTCASSLCILLVAGGALGRTVADNPAFMIVGGISAASEMCLAVASGFGTEEAAVALEPCAAAAAAGDGRELWRHLPNGQLASAVEGKCISTSGDLVVMAACDDASAWEAQGNGQLKLGGAGQRCLSQQGVSPGAEDAAAHGAISASSSDTMAHGASMAVDGSSNTFWASQFDPRGPVTITVDLGGEKRLGEIAVKWEFPAKAFTISVSLDSMKWTEVYATDSNVLDTSRISLGGVPAARVRVVMKEAAGTFLGHAVYGIRTLAVLAPRLRSIVEDCALAAKSADARDKYFEAYVSDAAPGATKALRSEAAALEAARASVATVVSELSQVLPQIRSCRGAASFIKTEGSSSVLDKSGQSISEGSAPSKAALDVDKQNGINTDEVGALIKEARRVIIAARSALN